MLTSGSDILYTPGILARYALVGALFPLPVTVSCAHSGYHCGAMEGQQLVAEEILPRRQAGGDGRCPAGVLVDQLALAPETRGQRPGFEAGLVDFELCGVGLVLRASGVLGGGKGE